MESQDLKWMVHSSLRRTAGFEIEKFTLADYVLTLIIFDIFLQGKGILPAAAILPSQPKSPSKAFKDFLDEPKEEKEVFRP